MNLKEMNEKQLLDLKARIDKQLDRINSRKKADALKAAQQAAKKFGFSLEELAGAPSGGKTRTKPTRPAIKGAPKYANPEDSSQTWTGKGRKPRWFETALKAGVDPEAMEI